MIAFLREHGLSIGLFLLLCLFLGAAHWVRIKVLGRKPAEMFVDIM